MSLVVVGVNHKTGSVALRERLIVPAKGLGPALVDLHRRVEGGVVLLQTCNRIEVYAHGEPPEEALAGVLREWFTERTDDPEARAELEGALYTHADLQAAGHLFRVAASLDSLVIGEEQVLGQVHQAYLVSQTEQVTDKVINGLFQRAFTVAKDIRTQTNISAGKVSVGSVAVDLAVSIFTDLRDKTVLVVGLGKMGQVALRNLADRGVGQILIANRSFDKARETAGQFGGEAVAFDQLRTHLPRADIVLSSTAAPGYVLNADDFGAALRARGKTPMFVIDIAAPRDIDPATNDLDSIYLYNIDDLKAVADENLAKRREELDRCLGMVDRQVAQFARWHHGLLAEPTIVGMSRELNAIRRKELEKTLAALPELDDRSRDEIEYLTKRIVNRILQQPMRQLKAEVADEDPNRVLHLVKRLFGLKEST